MAGKKPANTAGKEVKPKANSRPVKPKAKAPAKPRAKPAPKPKGRPALYTLELGERLCGELASGVSMRTACKPDDMPCAATVFGWMRKHPEFLDMYTRAKAEAADALVEEMMDISDDGTNDWMEIHDKDGECVGYKVNGEHVQRSRLRVETRKWIAAKLKPKKYGDKVDVSHGVQPDNPIVDLMGQLAGKTLKPVTE